jgi:hypothetical protein
MVAAADLDDLSLRQLDAGSDGHKLMSPDPLSASPPENVTPTYILANPDDSDPPV